MADIALECPKCNGRTLAIREPADPACAVRVQIMCPACNPGDFDSPVYFDAEGNEVPWHEGVA